MINHKTKLEECALCVSRDAAQLKEQEPGSKMLFHSVPVLLKAGFKHKQYSEALCK